MNEKEETPFLSIIIPAYNSEKTLSKCLDSILRQSLSYECYEIIIVNDGSTDKTREICEKYREEYKNIIVIHKHNEGIVIARSIGANYSNGVYIMSVDSDDTIEEGFLEYIYNNLVTFHPDMVAWGYNMVDKEGKLCKVFEIQTEKGLYIGKSLEQIKKQYMYSSERAKMNSGCLFFSLWSKAIRRNIYIEAVSDIDKRTYIGEDLLITLKALLLTHSLLFLDKVFYNYHIYQNSATQNVSLVHLDYQQILLNQLINISEKHNFDRNPIYAYSIYSIFNFLVKYVLKDTSYKNYSKAIKAAEKRGLFCFSKFVIISKPSIIDRFELLSIKNKFWPMLYFIIRGYHLYNHLSPV